MRYVILLNQKSGYQGAGVIPTQNNITLGPRHPELPGDLLKDSLSKILVKSPLNIAKMEISYYYLTIEELHIQIMMMFTGNSNPQLMSIRIYITKRSTRTLNLESFQNQNINLYILDGGRWCSYTKRLKYILNYGT